MKLNGISDNQGSSPSRKRVGRGIGSGMGKTGGRGVKGQKSRSGVSINGFEGGQMPIYRRLPKRGFSNAKFASDFNEVSIARLEQAVEAKRLDAKKVVDAAALKEAGVIPERDEPRDALSEVDYAMQDLVYEWGAMLLGQSFGTGAYEMFGGFSVDLVDCVVTDDRHATPSPDGNISVRSADDTNNEDSLSDEEDD